MLIRPAGHTNCSCYECRYGQTKGKAGGKKPDVHGINCYCPACLIQRRNWKKAGEIADNQEVTQDGNPSSKRDTNLIYEGGIWWSRPHAPVLDRYGKPEKSIPYDKKFGQKQQEENGETVHTEYEMGMDGPVDALFYGALGTGQWAK